MNEQKKINAGNVLLILAVVVAILMTALWAFQGPRQIEMALSSGAPGVEVRGYYVCDGVRTDFAAVTPATIGFSFRCSYEFYAEKNDPAADFKATLNSTFRGAGAATSGASTAVKASYSNPFPGFSFGSMGATKATK